ncbi:hypothetical protein BZG36_04910 [Bifiguratus adelaidae]|uniref:Uncharacterized protein n=1 Tax=Bifiguratus adelaidae TaxID=1938954 RepID=A0A261XV56_9FUNG|nr:hypothetical protein BZG36_04910 [Bifiguratus adelaidae]
MRSKVKILAECLDCTATSLHSICDHFAPVLARFLPQELAQELADLKSSGYRQPLDKAQTRESPEKPPHKRYTS